MAKRKKKVLVIEDETEMVDAIKTRLEANNYEVVAAYDGEDGLAKAHSEKPDLITMDLMLPGMSGFDVCRKLKIDENYKKIPIVMVTAKFQPNDIDFGRELGADAYITKPFGMDVLLDKIRELAGR